MSLLLTSQNNAVNSRPFDYQNYFSNTFKIEKNSLIALNHVTINRNAYFNFDEEKILSFYHGVEMSGKKVIRLKDITAETGDKYALLRNNTSVLNSREINNFVNYPMVVMIDKGEYSISQLCQNLQQNLNNPTGTYGGDFHVTGFWTVTPVYNSDNEFQNIQFLWDTETRNINAEFPQDSDFQTKYEEDDGIQMIDKGADKQINGTSGNTGTAVGEIYRFINQAGGTLQFDNVDDNGTIVGLTRVTNGRDFVTTSNSSFDGSNLYNLTGQNSGKTRQYDKESCLMFDICVAVINGELRIFYLEATDDNYDVKYTMKEYDYGSGSNVAIYAGDTKVKFTVSGNNIEVFLQAYVDSRTITLTLPPTGNNTYQLIPKVVLLNENNVLIKSGTKPKLLPDTIVPIVPTVNRGYDAYNKQKTTDFSNCNIGWVLENVWFAVGNYPLFPLAHTTHTKDYTHAKLSNNYIQKNYYKLKTWTPYECDIDATTVVNNGQKVNIATMETKPYWWSYDFDPTLNTNAGGFKYAYIEKEAGKEYIYEPKGTVIIPYNTRHLHFHCGGTIDGALGIEPRWSKGGEVTEGNNQVIKIVGTDRIALNTNDLLYIRIDLGNAYSVNGNTSSVSKIISPIITNTNTSNDTQLGIRTFTPPERMYLKLNNSEDLYINSINVSIVNKNEEFARDLAPTTSASFHIKSA